MDNLVVVYPYYKKTSNTTGKLNITKERYDNILNYFTKNKTAYGYNSSRYKYYVHNNFELCIYDLHASQNGQSHFIVNKKKCVSVDEINDMLVVKYEYESNIDSYSFPRLKEYHNETMREENILKFNNVQIHLLKENEVYYVYISFYNKSDVTISDEIMKDIATITNKFN